MSLPLARASVVHETLLIEQLILKQGLGHYRKP
jgi:hypothetical protein